MKIVTLIAVLFPTAALAITSPQHGPYAEAGIATAVSVTGDLALGPALSGGVWFGPYDDVYSLGKYTSIGVVSQFFINNRAHSVLEIRRGLDMLVINTFFAAGIGVDATPINLSPVIRVGAGLKRRKTPHWGWAVRADGLIEPQQGNHTFQLSLTGAFSRPTKSAADD